MITKQLFSVSIHGTKQGNSYSVIAQSETTAHTVLTTSDYNKAIDTMQGLNDSLQKTFALVGLN